MERRPGRRLGDFERLEAERALVRECKRGEPRALEAFFRGNVRQVERTLGRLVGYTHELEDLVQTTFQEALRTLPSFRGEASLSSWVTHVAVNVARHHIRSHVRRRARLTLATTEEIEAHEAPEVAPEPRIDSERAARRLHAALDDLPEAQRVALLLHLVEGYKVDEVATLMGAGRAATRARLWLGRRRLRAALEADPHVRAVLAEAWKSAEESGEGPTDGDRAVAFGDLRGEDEESTEVDTGAARRHAGAGAGVGADVGAGVGPAGADADVADDDDDGDEEGR